ncbi:hypothetical protein SAMN04489712_11420 [Thermomonospora echinospora]|uniref:Uncharacterized protein n=1 Tax=Thermomonospora echinospora TaxID=1992 RepID=A0A1H6D7I0_9ACTN|nr:hypothetical protein [Thermomonospora echinospora]SEG81299.1 hypothetical protein SAMN04489712_11420 [Thermomonospora echinospora]
MALGPVKVATPAAALPYAIAALVLLPAVPYLLALIAGTQAALARALLQRGSGERLQAELVEVAHSRARLVDAFEAPSLVGPLPPGDRVCRWCPRWRWETAGRAKARSAARHGG